MSNLKSRTALLFSLGILFCVNTPAQNSEKPVKMKDLPKAVQKTVQEQSKGATISGLSREIENGKVYYELEIKVNGHNKDVIIDPTGAVVSIEEVVSIASLPPAVRIGLENHAGGGEIRSVESITRNNAVVAYEAEIKIGKKYLEIRVGPDGKLIATENDDDDDDDDDNDNDNDNDDN